MEKWDGRRDIPLPGRWKQRKRSDDVSIDSGQVQGEEEMTIDEYDAYKEYLVAPFITLPDKKSFLSLFYIAGPIFFIIVGKLIEFWAMTIRAGDFGMVALACHNVLMRVFFFFGTFGDGLAQAAQTFLPGFFVKGQKKISDAEAVATLRNDKDDIKANVKPMLSNNYVSFDETPPKANSITMTTSKRTDKIKLSRSEKARKVIQKLATISILIGSFISITARYMANNAGSAFTSDMQLVFLMSKVSNYMGLVLLLHPLKEMLEGTMIASRDLKYLLWSYGVTAVLFLVRLKVACVRFIDIWQTLLVFQCVRIGLYGARAWFRTTKKRIWAVKLSG